MSNRRKICRQCQGDFAASICNFYRAKSNADGLKNICKGCHNASCAERAELKAEQVKAVKAAYGRRPEVRAKKAAYAKTDRGRIAMRAGRRRYLRWQRLVQHQEAA